MNPTPPYPPQPPYPPTPPQWHVPDGTKQPGAMMRALCGPLLLTTLGMLLAIDYSGHASFWRTWPALLIVFGLCKVAERITS
jgi:hypothetical protein